MRSARRSAIPAGNSSAGRWSVASIPSKRRKHPQSPAFGNCGVHILGWLTVFKRRRPVGGDRRGGHNPEPAGNPCGYSSSGKVLAPLANKAGHISSARERAHMSTISASAAMSSNLVRSFAQGVERDIDALRNAITISPWPRPGARLPNSGSPSSRCTAVQIDFLQTRLGCTKLSQGMRRNLFGRNCGSNRILIP